MRPAGMRLQQRRPNVRPAPIVDLTVKMIVVQTNELLVFPYPQKSGHRAMPIPAGHLLLAVTEGHTDNMTLAVLNVRPGPSA